MPEFDLDAALATHFRLERRTVVRGRWGNRFVWKAVRGEDGKVLHFPEYNVEAALMDIYNDQCDAASEICDIPMPNVDDFRLVPVEKGADNPYA